MDQRDVYFIPVNYTDAGRVFGFFELRNCIEAVVLALPTILLCTAIAHATPFSLTVKLIISLCLIVPVCGFALIGIRDDALSRFLKTYIRWRKNRRIVLNKGGIITHDNKRGYIRKSSRRSFQ